jgi:hypothetical protein
MQHVGVLSLEKGSRYPRKPGPVARAISHGMTCGDTRWSFAIDILACPDCGGLLRLLATIEDTPARGFRRAGRAVVEKILTHLGLPVDPPREGQTGRGSVSCPSSGIWTVPIVRSHADHVRIVCLPGTASKDKDRRRSLSPVPQGSAEICTIRSIVPDCSTSDVTLRRDVLCLPVRFTTGYVVRRGKQTEGGRHAT